MKKIKFLIFIGLALSLVTACNKDANKAKAHLTVSLTDAPANYDAVMIDVQGTQITGSGGSTVVLNTSIGIYNLLDFTNGLDTILATGDLDAGTVSQIRLILGSDNTVMVDGIVYPLSTPSAMQSGLKLQIHQTFEPGVLYKILLDFDANQSIVLKGNGEYQLKPVIRTIDEAISGSIRGSISPVGVIALITANSNGMISSSVCNGNGDFLLAGLAAGIYDITVTPPFPMEAVTISGIIVVVGISTDTGIIAL